MTDVIWEGPEALRPLLVPLANLTRLPGNPRRGDTTAVADSLREFGQRKPVVARLTEPGSMSEVPHGQLTGTTTAGNHVADAAALLGWTRVAAVFIEEDERTGNAYALADNRTHDLGADDLSDLYAMLDGLDGMLEGTGWTVDDVSALHSELHPAETRVTNTTTPVTVPPAQWPVIRMLLQPETHADWMRMWYDLEGETDTDKAQAIIRRMIDSEGDTT